MKNSSSTIWFFSEERWNSPSSGGWRGHGGENRDSVKHHDASDWLQPLVTNVWLTTMKRKPQFLSKLYIRGKLFVHPQNNNPPQLNTVAEVRSPPPLLWEGQLGSCSCILTQRGFVHWLVGTDGQAWKAGKSCSFSNFECPWSSRSLDTRVERH